MKLMIASDIHGSAYYCREMFQAFEREGADRLLLLWDLLYHGPRNDLPKEYNPKEVISMLNDYKNKIFCVRGNCDTEVDQMVLEFPIMAEYSVLELINDLQNDNCRNTYVVYAIHGHKYNPSNLPPLNNRDILLNGHTHVPACIEYEKYIYMNPGSISIPKEGSFHSYMIAEDGVFQWKSLEGEVYNTYLLS